MPQRHLLCTLTLSTFALVPAISAFAQAVTSSEPPAASPRLTWQTSQAPAEQRLEIITIDQPHRRHSCRVKSFLPDKLVCSSAFGRSRSYLPQQVIALIIPGDKGLKLWWVLGFNSASGVAIWGTIVLAVTCPACAAVTAVVALAFLGAAGAILYGDDQPDRLLYLAPGQQLRGTLHVLQPRPCLPTSEQMTVS